VRDGIFYPAEEALQGGINRIMSRFTRLSLTGVAAVSVLLLAACSSSSKSTSSSATSAPSGSAAGSSSGTSGTAVKAVFINDSGTQTNTDDAEGIKIGLDAVNAAGGVNGHPVQITTCTDTENPNEAATCARNAVSDSSVLAIVGTGTSYGTNVDPILEAAGLASIGNSTYTAADFMCSVCFNDSAGDFDSIGSALAAVKLLNAKKIGIPYIDLPAGASLGPLVNSLVKPLGGTTVGVVPVPVTAADVTPQAAAEGAAHPDAIIDGLTTELFSKFIHAYRSQGFQTPIIASGGVYDASGVSSQLSGVNSNIYIDTEFNHSSPGYQTFLADVSKYDPSYGNRTDEVLRTYLAVKEFAYAASHAQSQSRSGILNEMKSLTFNTDGLTPPIDYSTAQTGLGGHAPSVYADTIWLYKFQNGTFAPIGTAGVNVFTGATES
jgi:ABC-type branched-subunit amino acid transport system substrate-binding protein